MPALIKKPAKNNASNISGAEKFGVPIKRVITNGIPLNIKKITFSVKGTGKQMVFAQIKKVAEITGYSLNDFMQAYYRPEIVGSKGFITWSAMPKADAKKNERVILVGGVAVPFHKRRKGYRVALQKELFKQIYSRFGELVKKDKNVFIQTQISVNDRASLNTLTRRLGYAIFKQLPEQRVIVLRKKLDSKEMETVLSEKKKSFFSRLTKKK